MKKNREINGFRQTEIGSIPEDWEVKVIANVVEKAKQIDPTKTPDCSFRYVDVTSVSKDALKITEYKDYMGENAPGRARKSIQTEDVIFATVRPTLRRIAYIDELFNGEICSTAFCVLRSKKDKLFSRYLYYYVQRDEFVDELAKLQRGASYPAVTDSDIKNQRILLPSLNEQVNIAFVLSKIQQTIEHQDKIIAKTKELKRSLMYRLFTYGLRGEELKETEIGLMPESWKLTSIGEAYEFTTKHRGIDFSKYKEIPFIPMEFISENQRLLHKYEMRKSFSSGTYYGGT